MSQSKKEGKDQESIEARLCCKKTCLVGFDLVDKNACTRPEEDKSLEISHIHIKG